MTRDFAMIPGTKIDLGGQEYLVPPLTWPQARELAEDLKLVLTAPVLFGTDGTLDAFVRIVGAALRRNYPELTDDKIEGLLDFGNCIAVLKAAIGMPPIQSASPVFMMPGTGDLPH